jgi:hypothetical protein
MANPTGYLDFKTGCRDQNHIAELMPRIYGRPTPAGLSRVREERFVWEAPALMAGEKDCACSANPAAHHKAAGWPSSESLGKLVARFQLDEYPGSFWKKTDIPFLPLFTCYRRTRSAHVTVITHAGGLSFYTHK